MRVSMRVENRVDGLNGCFFCSSHSKKIVRERKEKKKKDNYVVKRGRVCSG